MAQIRSGTFTAANQSSDTAGNNDQLAAGGMLFSGRVTISRDGGAGVLRLEQRTPGTTTWWKTGDKLYGEGTVVIPAGFTSGIEYRLVCESLTSGSIKWSVDL